MLQPTVHIVDDDELDRMSIIRSLKESEIPYKEYESSESFLESWDSILIGCLIVDVRMPGLDGVMLQRQLVEKGLSLPVIVCSGVATVPVATEAMRLGALDVLEKPVAKEDLLRLVRRGFAESEKAFQRSELAERISQELGTLTPKEREVLPYVCEGYSLKAITAQFGFGFTTAARHQSRILEKFNSCNALQLLRRFQDAEVRIDIPEEQMSSVD